MRLFHFLSFSRPCSQIDEEIEDLDDGGDDSEMTCINGSDIKQAMKESKN